MQKNSKIYCPNCENCHAYCPDRNWNHALCKFVNRKLIVVALILNEPEDDPVEMFVLSNTRCNVGDFEIASDAYVSTINKDMKNKFGFGLEIIFGYDPSEKDEEAIVSSPRHIEL